MSNSPLDPETALPWQKLGAALADLLGPSAPPDSLLSGAYRPGLDAHEARVRAVADMLVGKGVIDPAEMEARMAALAAKLAGDKDEAHAKTRFSNALPNDIGGLPGGPVDPSAGSIEPWQKLAVALGGALGARKLSSVHERRRIVEDLGDGYHRLGYFERMVQGTVNLLAEKGVLTRAEVESRLAAMKQRHKP